ncbi:hypothetical protein ACWF7H_01160 [Peribacillus butanolivorans]
MTGATTINLPAAFTYVVTKFETSATSLIINNVFTEFLLEMGNVETS